MAGYKKKRTRELKHDRFRDTAMIMLKRVTDRLEGKGRLILVSIAGALVAFLLGYVVITWRYRHAEEAERALGRGIKIATASVSTSAPAETGELHFSSEQERAQKAIEEFRKVEAKYGEPYRSEARFFIATNLLVVDRPKGLIDLGTLSGSGNHDVATLAKFALAQAKEEDHSLDEAAALYADLAKQNDAVVTPEIASLRLALVYEKQGKRKDAADLLFNIVEAARKAKDPDGRPATQSAAAREAATELQKVDAARYSQLTPEASAMELPLGS